MNDRHPLRRRLSSAVRSTAPALALAIALALGLAACGDDSGSSTTDGAASETQTAANGEVFNDADVRFATDMIPHHAQAIEMVTLTDGRALDPDVAALAQQIREAQVPEVEDMTDWLTAWGQEVPETSLDHTNAGHDMEGMSDMPGMMSAEEMTSLQSAADADFQRMWLEMMVRHHEGAIEMAETEEAHGEYPAAIALARSIQAAQQAEIDQMHGMLEG